MTVLFFITPEHGQPHAVFGGFISISGGWRVVCREPIVAEDIPHITTLDRIALLCSVGVLAGVSAL